MINFVETQPIPTIGTVAVAVGAAIMGSQFQYPMPVEKYQIEQASSTFSFFEEGLHTVTPANEVFAKEIASIYASFAERQEALGTEFEAAIFGDLEGLYEA